MFRAFTDILQGLAQILPPEVLVVLVVLGLVAAYPAWLHSVRVKQIKAQLRRAARAPTEAERLARYEDAFRIAKGRPRRLVALAEMGIEKRLKSVWQRALAELEATGRAELDLLRLRKRAEPPPASARDVLELEVRVERLLEDGLHVAAREIVDDARARYPDDPQVERLHDVVDRASVQADEKRPDPALR